MEQEKKWGLTVSQSIDGITLEGPHITLHVSSGAAVQGKSENENGVKILLEGWAFCERTAEKHTSPIPGDDTLINDIFKMDKYILKRQVSYDSKKLSAFHIRLRFENRSAENIKLFSLSPVLVKETAGMALRDEGLSEWMFMRQGRHKNDMPSVCELGNANEAYMDALRGLNETGGNFSVDMSNLPDTITSDQLSIVRGSRGKGPGSLLIGFLTGMSQLVKCEITGSRRNKLEKLEAVCMMDGILVKPGEGKDGEWVCIDANENVFDAVKDYTTLKGQMCSSISAPNPPSVYCTWYYYGETVTQQDVVENLTAISDMGFPIDVVQIDEGWEIRLGHWEANHKFPLGMKYLADLIKSHGYRPGIWTSPFIFEPRCEIRYYHPDWILRGTDGKPVIFKMNECDNYVLDVTHPGVLKWIEELYHKLTFEWGFTYHKLDFTRAVAVRPDAVFYNKNVTRAEAFRMGVEAVRRGAGKDAYILICGGLFDAPSGLVDAHRTGSDVLSMWPVRKGDAGQGSNTGKGLKAEILAPHTIKQNVLRFWMNDLWHNDPDALMVRRRTVPERALDLSLGLLTDEETKIFTLNQYFGGGIVCFTEPMREIEKDRLGLLRHIIPSIGKAAVPRDLFEDGRYPCIFDTAVKSPVEGMGEWHTLAVVNWSNAGAERTLVLDENIVGEYVKQHESFLVSEFWSGRIWGPVGYGQKIELDTIPPHSAKLLKIVPFGTNKTVLLYSSGHFSMGGTEVTLWEEQEKGLKMGLEWKWHYPLKLVLQAPENRQWYAAGTERDEASVSAVSYLEKKRCAKPCEVHLEGNRLVVMLSGKFSGTVNAFYK